MYRSTQAQSAFTAREAISSKKSIMNQLVIILSAMLSVKAFGCGRKENSVERGKYLVTLGGCNDCHTVKNQVPFPILPPAQANPRQK